MKKQNLYPMNNTVYEKTKDKTQYNQATTTRSKATAKKL